MLCYNDKHESCITHTTPEPGLKPEHVQPIHVYHTIQLFSSLTHHKKGQIFQLITENITECNVYVLIIFTAMVKDIMHSNV